MPEDGDVNLSGVKGSIRASKKDSGNNEQASEESVENTIEAAGKDSEPVSSTSSSNIDFEDSSSGGGDVEFNTGGGSNSGSAANQGQETVKVPEPPKEKEVKNTLESEKSSKKSSKVEERKSSSIPFLPTDKEISEKAARSRLFALQRAQSRRQSAKIPEGDFSNRDFGTSDSQIQAFIRRAKDRTTLTGNEARAIRQMAESGAGQREIEETLQDAGFREETSKLAGGFAQESLDSVNVIRQGAFIAGELTDKGGQTVEDVPSGIVGGAATLGAAFVNQPYREGIPETVGLLTGGSGVTATASTSSSSSLSSAVNPAEQTTSSGFKQSNVRTPDGQTAVQKLETAGPTSKGQSSTGSKRSDVPGNEQLPSGFTDQGTGQPGTTETVQESAVTGGNFKQDVVKQRTPETQTQETGFGQAQGEAEFTGTGSEPSQVPTEETDSSLTVSKEEIQTLAQRREKTSGADVEAQITGFADENSKRVNPSNVKFTGSATDDKGNTVTLTEKLKKEAQRSLNSNTIGLGPGSLVPAETKSTTKDKSSNFVEPDIGFGDTDTSSSPSIDPVDSSKTSTGTGLGSESGTGTGTSTSVGSTTAASLSIDSGSDLDAPFEGQPQGQGLPQSQPQRQGQPQTQTTGQTPSSTSSSTSFTAQGSSFNFQQTPSTGFDTDSPGADTNRNTPDSDFDFDLGGDSEETSFTKDRSGRNERERGIFIEADLVSQTLAKVQGEDTSVAFSEGRQSKVNLFGAPTKAEAEGRIETDLTGGQSDFDVDIEGGDTL